MEDNFQSMYPTFGDGNALSDPYSLKETSDDHTAGPGPPPGAWDGLVEPAPSSHDEARARPVPSPKAPQTPAPEETETGERRESKSASEAFAKAGKSAISGLGKAFRATSRAAERSLGGWNEFVWSDGGDGGLMCL